MVVGGGAGSSAGAERTSDGNAAGRKDRLPQPWSTGGAGLAQGEGGWTTGGGAGEVEWREEEEEGGTRGEEKGGS